MKLQSAVVPHIDISYSGQTDFPQRVESALTRINSGKTGGQLIEGLRNVAEKGKKVTIKESHQATAARAVLTTDQAQKFGIRDDIYDQKNNAKAIELAQKGKFTKGEGSAAVIEWNTQQGLKLNPKGVPIGVDDRNKAWLALAHEMIHASRITRGTYTGGTGDGADASSPAGKEELRAVGLDGKTPSENSIRAEHGEPLRTAYLGQAQPERSGPVRSDSFFDF